MLRFWIIIVTILNTALAVLGGGVAIFATGAQGVSRLLGYFAAAICLVCALSGYLNLWFLSGLARQREEKAREARARRQEEKALRAARDRQQPPAAVPEENRTFCPPDGDQPVSSSAMPAETDEPESVKP